MNIGINSNISFQKKLVATSHVGEEINRQQVSIYELDDFKDRFELDKLYATPSWDRSYYVEDINDEFIRKYTTGLDTNKHFYLMENEQKEPICVGVLDKSRKRKNKLTYIETAYSYSSYGDGKKRIKYIGETMMAFLAKMTKKEDKNLEVEGIAQRAKTQDFYFNQCGFRKINEMTGFLKKDELKKLISQNKSHTGSKIKLLF